MGEGEGGRHARISIEIASEKLVILFARLEECSFEVLLLEVLLLQLWAIIVVRIIIIIIAIGEIRLEIGILYDRDLNILVKFIVGGWVAIKRRDRFGSYPSVLYLLLLCSLQL